MAETAITDGSAAGQKCATFPASLPAAATRVTPAAAVLASAVLNAVLGQSQPKLMLTTSIVDACVVTQSRAAMMPEIEPLPVEPRTLTAHSRTPGATPTTPKVLSSAPAVPAT